MRNHRNLRDMLFGSGSLCTVDDDFTDEERAAFADGGTPLEPAPVEPPVPALETPPAAAPAPAAPVAAVADPAVPAPDPDGAVEQPDPADPTKQVKMVPHGALHAERAKLAAKNQEFALLQSRVNAMLAKRAEPLDLGAAEPPPDIAEDPVKYLSWLQGQMETLRDHTVAQANARAEEQHQTQVDQAVGQDEAAFTAYTPDYPEASLHYVRSRGTELLQFHTPQAAEKILRAEVRQIAEQQWAKGRPAAEAYYALARARGYVPGQTSVFADAKPAVAAPAPAQAAPTGGPTPAETVAAVRAAQASGRTLSGGAGGTAAVTTTADDLLKMSDDDFANYLKIGTKQADSRFMEVAGA